MKLFGLFDYYQVKALFCTAGVILKIDNIASILVKKHSEILSNSNSLQLVRVEVLWQLLVTTTNSNTSK